MILLKDPRTNWKHILIWVILAVIVGGGILVYTKYSIQEITFFTKFPEIKKPEKIVEDEITSLFKKIFPNGITKSDLDKITDVNERAKAYFQGPTYDDFESTYWGSIEHVELDEKPNTEIFITLNFNESYFDPEIAEKIWPVMPQVGPIFVFRWNESEWDLVGELSFGPRSWYTIGEIKPDSLADISTRHHWSAGSHWKDSYEWNGTEYMLKEKAMCGWDSELEKEWNCVVWPEQEDCYWNDVEWKFECKS